jgi:uncharacterized membrane protein YgdD (TMEM256/DUF423 family)
MKAKRLAAIFGLLGVALGAFGGHAFPMYGVERWNTAALYHLVHAAAMLASGHADGRASRSTYWFAAGITLFSGSLYVMALTDVRALGVVTPFGGLALLIGWILLIRDNKS